MSGVTILAFGVGVLVGGAVVALLVAYAMGITFNN